MRSKPRWIRWTATALGIGAVGGILAAAAGARRWRLEGDRMVRVLNGAVAAAGPPISFERLDHLPAPVARYFRAVLRDGQPRIRQAIARQRGTFRSRTGGDVEQGWSPFTAVQHFTAAPPGFVWDARIRMAAPVTVRVRDGYTRGAASMLGAVAALVPVVDAADGPELRAGALLRWLAEAVWLPTALLPGAGVTWTPMDESHARATVTDAETTVSLEFEFGADGLIAEVRAPERWRAVPGKAGEYHRAVWGGRYGRYEVRTGMRVPAEAEVFWVLGGREEPYYRGRNVSMEYDF